MNRGSAIFLLRQAAISLAAGNFVAARAEHELAGALIDELPMGGESREADEEHTQKLIDWLRSMPIDPSDISCQ